MAKRLTATEKWIDPWFCSLSERDRLFWLYLLDNCNHAGIWSVNPMLVQTYFPGYVINSDIFGDRVTVLSGEKWFINKFVEFQYGSLNKENRVHSSVIAILKKEVSKPLARPMLAPSKPLARPMLGCKDKDKDKKLVKDKDRDKDRDKENGSVPSHPLLA